MLSRYLHKATPSHVVAEKYVIQYLIGILSYGTYFTSNNNTILEVFVNFPTTPGKVVTFTDTDWGPQDESVPFSTYEPSYLDLIKPRSISGYLIWLSGPLFWVLKHQSITAHSTVEAVVYTTHECIKKFTHLQNIFHDLVILLKLYIYIYIHFYNNSNNNLDNIDIIYISYHST